MLIGGYKSRQKRKLDEYFTIAVDGTHIFPLFVMINDAFLLFYFWVIALRNRFFFKNGIITDPVIA